MAELNSRADDLRGEVARAELDGAALREDASSAATRASEARSALATYEKEAARLASRVDALRATKGALESELAGLRHELDARRGRENDGMAMGRAADRRRRGGGGDLLLEEGGRWTGPLPVVGEGDHGEGEEGGKFSARYGYRRRPRGVVMPVGEGHEDGGEDGRGLTYGGVDAEAGGWKGADYGRRSGSKEDVLRVSRDNGGHGGGRRSGKGADDFRTGSLVEIVAEFQGRLRRQVQAALADGSGGGVQSGGGGKAEGSLERSSSSFSRVTTIGLVDGPLRLRETSGLGRGDVLVQAGGRQEEGDVSGRELGSRGDILGQLEKRIGCV